MKRRLGTLLVLGIMAIMLLAVPGGVSASPESSPDPAAIHTQKACPGKISSFSPY